MIKKNTIRKSAAWNDNQGFTLIEIMIAMVIFAVGMLSVAAMQTSATRGNTSANRSTRGFIWCSDRMEVLMSLPYTDPILNDTGGPQAVAQTVDGIDNNYDGQIDEAGETGDVNLTYSVVDNAVLLNTKTIIVTVTWQAGRKNLRLTTVRARNANG